MLDVSRIMRKLIVIALITVAVAIVAIALAMREFVFRKPTPSNLVASYKAERSYGLEFLELRTNGIYVQIFTNSTTVRTNVGTWTLQAPTLTLKAALIFDDGSNRPAATVVTNDWQLATRWLFNIWILGDGRAESFVQITPENQSPGPTPQTAK